MSITIALVAPGAMGSGLAARLGAKGAQVLTTLAGRSERSRARAQAAGMSEVAPETLLQAPYFLSVVPPSDALELARQFAQWCQHSEHRPMYIDLNAINPNTAGQVQAVVEAAGAVFVDGCIIGFPPSGDEIGPTLYLSGPSGRAAELLSAHGLVTRTLEGGVGAASALKMAYAGLSKGLPALGVAMVLAAARNGASAALRAELADSRPHILSQLERSLPDLLPKAGRWAPEMEEIAAFIGTDRPESEIFTAMAQLYRAIAADLENGGKEAALLRAFAQGSDT